MGKRRRLLNEGITGLPRTRSTRSHRPFSRVRRTLSRSLIFLVLRTGPRRLLLYWSHQCRLSPLRYLRPALRILLRISTSSSPEICVIPHTQDSRDILIEPRTPAHPTRRGRVSPQQSMARAQLSWLLLRRVCVPNRPWSACDLHTRTCREEARLHRCPVLTTRSITVAF